MPTTGAAGGAGSEVVRAIGGSSPARRSALRDAPHHIGPLGPCRRTRPLGPRGPSEWSRAASDTVRPRWPTREGAGPLLPHPGSPAAVCPSGRNRLPTPSSSEYAYALPAKIQRPNVERTEIKVIGHAPGVLGLLRLVVGSVRVACCGRHALPRAAQPVQLERAEPGSYWKETQCPVRPSERRSVPEGPRRRRSPS